MSKFEPSSEATAPTRIAAPGARPAWCLWLLCSALLLPLVAESSEVVDLRVGSHEEFTRVVFELDTPAGYRISRESPAPGVSELVVTLEAMSIPRRIQVGNSPSISEVRIETQGDSSLARIRLETGGLKMKEMILADPPRIVIDVLAPASTRAPKAAAPGPPKTAKPRPESAGSKTRAAPKKSTTPRSESAPTPPRSSPAPAPKPAPKPKSVAEAAGSGASTPSSGGSGAAAKAGAEAARGDRPLLVIRPLDSSGESAAEAPKPASAGGPAADSDASARARSALPAASRPQDRPVTRSVEKRRPAPLPPRKTTRKLPRAPLAEPPSSGIGAGGVIVIALFALLAAGLLWVRRRRAAEARESEAEEPGAAEVAVDEANPFADRSQAGTDDTPAEREAEPVPAAAGFEDLEAADEPMPKEAAMDLFSDRDAVEESIGIPDEDMAPAEVASETGEDGETMRMMREFERRIASLESRFDEAVDARERLERQVAAQTEELRVQRAAIARTQRAVRNLNRPDDEGPTEPAPRDPT